MRIPLFVLKKKITLIGLCLTFSVILHAQKGKDILYLKNGSIIKGTITSQDSSVRIQTKDGSAFVYLQNAIDTMVIFSNTQKNERSDHNRLWVGWFGEPQLQGITMSQKEKNYYAHSPYAQGAGRGFPLCGGLATGISISYEAPQTVGFETGLVYHLYQSQLKQVSGYSFESAHFRSSSLEVPISLLLHTNGAKVRLYTSIGFSGGIVLADQFHYRGQDGNGMLVADTTYHYHADSSTALYCTLNVKSGVEIEATPHLLVKVGVSFTASSTSVLGFDGSYFSYYSFVNVPYNVGLNVSLQLRVDKRAKNKKGGKH